MAVSRNKRRNPAKEDHDKVKKKIKTEDAISDDSGLEFIDDEGEKVCEVEKVLSKQIKRDGSIHYLLKWSNYKGEPTWEPESNCVCYKLIDEFEKIVAKRQKAMDLAEQEENDNSNFFLRSPSPSQSQPKRELRSINGKLVRNTHTKSVMRNKKIKRSFSKPCPLSKKPNQK